MPDQTTISVDDALKAVMVAEATYNADSSNVDSIESNIATATQPLADAQAKVASDVTTYNSAVDDAIAALTASKK